MYKIIFDKQAINFLNKLEKDLKLRIWNKLEECKTDPFRFLKHLEEINGYKLRVGNYRIILDVDIITKTLKILRIGHRKNVYS